MADRRRRRPEEEARAEDPARSERSGRGAPPPGLSNYKGANALAKGEPPPEAAAKKP
jgi:hypothetical protein